MDAAIVTKSAALERALKEIADATSQDLTLRQLLVFLHVAGKGFPVPQQELVDSQDQYKSTISKIVSVLGGQYLGSGSRGMGLLEVTLDPNDRRARLLSLSKLGEKVISRAMKRL